MSDPRRPETVSVSWLLAELAGMSFPSQGQAYDYFSRMLRPTFKTGVEIMKARAAKRDVELPTTTDSWPADLFERLGLPLVVGCTECEATMAFPTAMVSPDGHIHCSDCVEGQYDARAAEFRSLAGPSFTRQELLVIWTAIQQYCDNHDDAEAPPVPTEAESVRGKLDAWVAAMAEVKP